MGNLGRTIKKFLSNKNTVTILGVILGVVVLYFGYNFRVKQAIEPKTIPMAKVAIASTEEITADMIQYVEVSSNFINKSPNLITNAGQLIGKRVTAGASVPVNGLFYTDVVVDADQLPDSAFSNIPDGYTVFNLDVDNKKTYGNSMYPGNYIDLYLKAKSDGKLVYGKFIESIEILDVKDSSGNHVFNGTTKMGTPDVLLFAVPDDLYLLLEKTSMLSGFELFPIPRNSSYTANPGETDVSSEALKNLVLSETKNL